MKHVFLIKPSPDQSKNDSLVKNIARVMMPAIWDGQWLFPRDSPSYESWRILKATLDRPTIPIDTILVNVER